MIIGPVSNSRELPDVVQIRSRDRWRQIDCDSGRILRPINRGALVQGQGGIHIQSCLNAGIIIYNACIIGGLPQ